MSTQRTSSDRDVLSQENLDKIFSTLTSDTTDIPPPVTPRKKYSACKFVSNSGLVPYASSSDSSDEDDSVSC